MAVVRDLRLAVGGFADLTAQPGPGRRSAATDGRLPGIWRSFVDRPAVTVAVHASSPGRAGPVPQASEHLAGVFFGEVRVVGHDCDAGGPAIGVGQDGG